MARLGFFDDKRVELIDGEILDISPQQPPHRRAVTRCFKLAAQLYHDPKRFFVVSQGTLRLGEDLPEPELYVLPCAEETPEADFPLPLWVLEIAGTTYEHDVGRKLAAYARNGIAEYLVLDIHRRRLEVYRQPRQRSDGWGYAPPQILGEGDTFRPSQGPAVEFPVARMLP